MKQVLLIVIGCILISVNVGAVEYPDVPECSTVTELPATIKDINAPSIECIGRFHDLMKMANHYGHLIGFPETMQAILMQETQGGRIRTDSRQEQLEWAAFGVMQIQPATAKWVLECLLHKDNVPDENIIKGMLKTNDSFSIHISAVYFKYLYDRYIKRGNHTGVAWRMALLAYNVGPGKLDEMGMQYDPNQYLNGIRSHIKIVKVYNQEYNL